MTPPDEMYNGYGDLLRAPPPVGDLCLIFNPDGSASVVKKPPEERPNTWKGARKIMSLPDSVIQVVPRRKSHVVDYHINHVDCGTVSFGHGRGKNRFLCHRPEHTRGSCPCIKLVRRFRKENAA